MANEIYNLVEELDKLEIQQGMDFIKDIIRPLLDIAQRYVIQVKNLQKSIEAQNLTRGSLKAYKYKSAVKKRQVLSNVQQVRQLILQGNYLLYNIREKITGEAIVFRTIIQNNRRKELNVVEIPYKDLFNNTNINFLTFKTKQNVMEATLTFLKSSVNQYHASQLSEVAQGDLEKSPIYSWEESSKILYLAAIKRWDERNKGKPEDEKMDSFNKGHIFEYIDQLNVLRQKTRNDHKPGVEPWGETLESEVNYIFNNGNKLMDQIAFIKGGDTLNAQNKLINASISSLKSVLNVFEGTSYYPGIITSFKSIIGNGSDKEKILETLMSLFSKQDEDLSNDILSLSTEESIDEIRKYMSNLIGITVS